MSDMLKNSDKNRDSAIFAPDKIMYDETCQGKHYFEHAFVAARSDKVNIRREELTLIKRLKVWMIAVGLVAALAACWMYAVAPWRGAATPSADRKTPGLLTLTRMLDSNPTWPFREDWLVWRLFEARTGVRLVTKSAPSAYRDTLNMTIASGDLPDLIYMDNMSANRFGQQGALVNLAEYRELMPNLQKRLADDPVTATLFTAGDGGMYLAPTFGIGETNRVTWMYREDVFHKHGIGLPRSFDELYTALKQLKKLYPDSYPLTSRSLILITNYLSVNFGTAGDAYYDFDNHQWKYGPVENNYKRMIVFLNRLYQEKLMPPTFLQMQTKQWQDQLSTGQSFVTFDAIGRIDSFNEALRKDEPDATMAFMPPPEGKNLNQAVNTVGLTVASTSAHIREAIRYLDFFYSEEGRQLASWGEEGITYTVKEGEKTFKPEYASVRELRLKTGLSTVGTYGAFDFDAHLSLFTPELVKTYLDSRVYDSRLQPTPAFNQKETEMIGLLNGSIQKYMTETVSKFILGEISLDEWDRYVDNLWKLGLRDYLDLYATAYERSLKMK